MPMFPDQEPPKRGSSDHFDFWKVAAGERFDAWIGGPYVPVLAHYFDFTKPCRERITKGAVPCPYDHETHILYWRAYVPLWTTEHRRIVVMVSELMRPFLLKAALHAPVVVGRTKEDKAAVTIKPRMAARSWGKEAGEDKRPLLIERWLLNYIWGDPVLMDHFNTLAPEPTSAEPVCEKPKPPVAFGEGVADAALARTMERFKRTSAAFLDENGNPVRGDPTKPSNGKHS